MLQHPEFVVLYIKGILGLLGVLIAMVGYLAKRHDRKHDRLSEHLEELLQRQISCMRIFASAESVVRVHTRLDEQDMRMDDLSKRVTRLEDDHI